MEASCEKKDIYLVEEKINKTIDEISGCKIVTLDEIKKAINIEVNSISSSARSKIEKAGGEIKIIEWHYDNYHSNK